MPRKSTDDVSTRLAKWAIKSHKNMIIMFIIVNGTFAGYSWLLAWLLTSLDNWDVDHSPMLHASMVTVFSWILGLILAWFYRPLIVNTVRLLRRERRNRD